MSSFFHGWRRKIGVVTLLLACAFAVAWASSMVVHSYLCIRVTSTHYSLHSIERRVALMRTYVSEPHDLACPHLFAAQFVKSNQYPTIVDNWHFLGCQFYRGRIVPYLWVWCLFVPYWAIVIPIALVSAWLLLTPPRKSIAEAPAIGDK